MPALKAGLTTEGAEGAEEGGKQGEGCRKWLTGGLCGLEGNRSTQRREDARAQMEATRGDGGVGGENGLGGTWQGNSKPRIEEPGVGRHR